MTEPRVSPWLPKLPELQTERLSLRQWSLRDLDGIVAMDRDPEVYRYLDEPGDPADQRSEMTERVLMDFGPGLGTWSIFLRTDPGRFLGISHIIPIDDEGPDVELGFRLVRAAWGKGLASEAAGAVLRHGFETVGLPEIIAVTDPDNKGSEKTLKRLGFKREGWRKAWGYDNHFFRLPRSRWNAQALPAGRR